jgi:hypothetical protein
VLDYPSAVLVEEEAEVEGVGSDGDGRAALLGLETGTVDFGDVTEMNVIRLSSQCKT